MTINQQENVYIIRSNNLYVETNLIQNSYYLNWDHIIIITTKNHRLINQYQQIEPDNIIHNKI